MLLNTLFVLAWVTLSSLYWRKSRCNGPGFEVLLAFLRLRLALKDVLRRSFGPVDCQVTSNVALMKLVDLGVPLWVDGPGAETLFSCGKPTTS